MGILVFREKTGAGCSWFSLFFVRWEKITIRTVVAGAAGRMGREMTKGLLQSDGIEVTGAVDLVEVGKDIGLMSGLSPAGIFISDELEEIIDATKPQVLVDFTVADAAVANARTAIKKGVRPVIGSTGFNTDQLDELHELCEECHVGAVIAPNFSLGAILMMHFARQAARFFPRVEIIELHHDKKIDAPSGTAIKTAELISEQIEEPGALTTSEEKIPGTRGGTYRGVAVHSLRLPGAVAHQEVIFGGQGQLLTIRHDTTSREAFLPGLILAVNKVLELEGVVYGLENLLEL